MTFRKLLPCLLMALAVITSGLPAQAGMIGTAQMKNIPATTGIVEITAQREWIAAQLQGGGVEKSRALERVASMTDAEIAQIYQRIDEVPAAGSSGEFILIAVIVFLVLEVTGVIDVIPEQ